MKSSPCSVQQLQLSNGDLMELVRRFRATEKLDEITQGREPTQDDMCLALNRATKKMNALTALLLLGPSFVGMQYGPGMWNRITTDDDLRNELEKKKADPSADQSSLLNIAGVIDARREKESKKAEDAERKRMEKEERAEKKRREKEEKEELRKRKRREEEELRQQLRLEKLEADAQTRQDRKRVASEAAAAARAQEMMDRAEIKRLSERERLDERAQDAGVRANLRLEKGRSNIRGSERDANVGRSLLRQKMEDRQEDSRAARWSRIAQRQQTDEERKQARRDAAEKKKEQDREAAAQKKEEKWIAEYTRKMLTQGLGPSDESGLLLTPLPGTLVGAQQIDGNGEDTGMPAPKIESISGSGDNFGESLLMPSRRGTSQGPKRGSIGRSGNNVRESPLMPSRVGTSQGSANRSARSVGQDLSWVAPSPYSSRQESNPGALPEVPRQGPSVDDGTGASYASQGKGPVTLRLQHGPSKTGASLLPEVPRQGPSADDGTGATYASQGKGGLRVHAYSGEGQNQHAYGQGSDMRLVPQNSGAYEGTEPSVPIDYPIDPKRARNPANPSLEYGVIPGIGGRGTVGSGDNIGSATAELITGRGVSTPDRSSSMMDMEGMFPQELQTAHNEDLT